MMLPLDSTKPVPPPPQHVLLDFLAKNTFHLSLFTDDARNKPPFEPQGMAFLIDRGTGAGA